MSVLESVFLGMFLIGFLFTVVSAVLSGAFGHAFGEGSSFDAHGAHPEALGGDVHAAPGAGHAEVGWAGHELSTFSPLSPTTISAFLAAAGGVGWVALTKWEWSPWASVLLAAVSGLVFAAVAFFGMTWLFRATQGSSLVSMAGLEGTEADVNIAIPSGSMGEIAYVSKGQRCTMAARCADGATVPQGARVVIKSVSPTVFVVEETRESWLARSRGKDPKAAH